MRKLITRPERTSLRAYLAPFVLLALIIGIVGCDNDDNDSNPTKDVLYIQSNHPESNQNSILAYEIKDDGSLTPITGSPFMTGGTGLANPEQALGPNDLDVPMVAHDGRLYAVNSGSHTIAVMDINEDGTLSPISGSPFSSGGENPVSIAIRNNKLYVVNKAQDPVNGNTMAPTYGIFNIESDGRLSSDAVMLTETTEGSSPSFAYIPDGEDIMFGTDFLGFMAEPPVGTLRSFKIDDDGLLNAVGEPQPIPVMGGALGLQKHPTEDVLYVGFPVTAEIGIYTYDDSGILTYKSKVASGPAACWIRANQADNRLYTLNSAEGTISVHNISDALNLASVQKLELKENGPLFTNPMGMQMVSSQPFHIELMDDHFAYVVSQRATPEAAYQEGNRIHIIKINDDGSLAEEMDPMDLPVPASARPQGIVIVK